MAVVRFGEFEWDRAKADSNQQKHGVSFEEASGTYAIQASLPAVRHLLRQLAQRR